MYRQPGHAVRAYVTRICNRFALIPLCESVAGLPKQIGYHVSSLFGREQQRVRSAREGEPGGLLEIDRRHALAELRRKSGEPAPTKGCRAVLHTGVFGNSHWN